MQDELIQCIDVKLAQLAKNISGKRIRLVVIDSVAAIFRSEFDDLSQRTFELRRLAQSLHEYMYDQDAAIVVCNQVPMIIFSNEKLSNYHVLFWNNNFNVCNFL